MVLVAFLKVVHLGTPSTTYFTPGISDFFVVFLFSFLGKGLPKLAGRSFACSFVGRL